MTATPTTHRPAAPKPARLFYVSAALLMLVLAFLGFYRFYLHAMAYPGREIPPPARVLTFSHAAVMTAWLLLLLLQPYLILRKSHRLHMTIGKIGAALAALILILGLMMAVITAQHTPPEVIIFGLHAKAFMAVPFLSVFIFAAFVILGIVYRRQPAIHRSMMFLATLGAISAAVARIDPLTNLYSGTIWDRLFGPFFFTAVIGLVLLIIRSVMIRSLDRPFALGLAALSLASLLIWQIAPTPAWDHFASLFVK